MLRLLSSAFSFFFFNDTATTEIYTLSLHDALPIFDSVSHRSARQLQVAGWPAHPTEATSGKNSDRKSTRLNSSHGYISYAVFCLKKKKHYPFIDFHIRTPRTHSRTSFFYAYTCPPD